MNQYGLVMLAFLLMVQGCSAPYYGYTKEQWDKLSAEQKAEARKEYQAILDARNQQAQDDKIDARTQSIIKLGTRKPDH